MRTLLIILATALALAVHADDKDRRKSGSGKMGYLIEKKLKNADADKPTTPQPAKPSKAGETSFSRDTVRRHVAAKTFPDVRKYYCECYADVVRQYGFWRGVGPRLSAEQVRHRSKHYRLLRPAGAPQGAPFTHMQVMNAFGQLSTDHSYGPLLANAFTGDDGIDISWKWKLQTICQFEQISRRGVMVQENMYDADGELVLQYLPTSVSRNHIIGHYADAYGVPATLRDDEEARYVSITLDDNGYESEIAFIDEDGRLRRNDDDVFIALRTYDKQGRRTSIRSADPLGRPTRDNWGNCGWQYYYNRQGLADSCICIDQHGRHMRMPSIKEEATDVWTIRYAYDRWGNRTMRAYYDNLGRPDTTKNGIHRYLYTYDDHGLMTSYRAEGLDGHLADYDTGKALLLRRYDSRGHMTYEETRDKDSLFTTRGDCMTTRRYDGDELVLRLDYNSTNGTDTILNYKVVMADGQKTTCNYAYGRIVQKQYDALGRNTTEAYYDLDMRPIKRQGYHKQVNRYTERPGYQLHEECYLDTLGHWADIKDSKYGKSYNREITETDSVRHIRTTASYDGTRLIEKYANLYNDDFSMTQGILNYDSIGYRGRTLTADALYYKALSTKSVQGKSTTWRGENEFGEPSYILNGDWDGAPIYCTDVIGDSYYFDENGDTIPSSTEGRKEFKNRLAKAFCIELVDSAALRLGLRTGDLIVRYGDWHYPVPSIYGRFHESLICLESVRKALQSKTMVVMRHDEATRTSRLIELYMPEGTTRQLGFVYHMLYLTQKERQRYEQVMELQRATVSVEAENTSMEQNEKVKFFTPYKVGDTSDKQLFMRGLQDNVVVVAWEPYTDGESYLFTCKNPLIDYVHHNDYDSVALHYTVDGRHVLRYVMAKDDLSGGRQSSTMVAYASDINALADSLQRDYDERHPQPVIALQPREAADRLRQIDGAEVTQDDGSYYRGNGNREYGDVKALCHVVIDYETLSYPDMLLAHNILSHMDYSHHFYVRNDSDWGYLKEHRGRFAEIAWQGYDESKRSVTVISGDISFQPKQLYMVDIVDASTFSRSDRSGEYVLLQADDWLLGLSRNYPRLSDGPAPQQLILARVKQRGDRLVVEKPATDALTENCTVIGHGYREVTDDVFRQAYQWALRCRKEYMKHSDHQHP